METTIGEHWIANNIVSVLVALIAAMTPILTAWMVRYFAKKDKLPHSVTKAVNKNRRLDHLCSELQIKINASRVNIWLFHNGGYFYTGEPIQKLSMICERNAEGVESIMHIFQNQPIAIFQRNLEKLTSNDWFREYNELRYSDSLATINTLYKIVSTGLFKLRNKEGYFAGILAVSYETNYEVTSGEIEAALLIARKIEQELSDVNTKH